MARSLVHFGLLAFLASCSGGSPDGAAPSPAPASKPNIIVVTLDTTRRDALSPYVGPPDATPTIQRLSSEGARFDRAYTVTPLTIPAHSSLFTGLFPPRHGVRDNGDYFLSDKATTLAELLKDAGYATMASVGAEVTSHHWGFAQGFDAYFDDMGQSAEDERNRWRVERRGDAVVDDAIGWLGARKEAKEPYFTWVHLFDAHHPYEPPEAFGMLFPGKPYIAEVSFADAQVGRVLQAAEALDPGLSNTWVFVLADHGESMGAHGEGMHGVLLYDETMNIPLVVRPPGGLPAMRVIQAPTSIVDIMPTALAAAGAAVPAGLDGVDLGAWLSPEGGTPAGMEDRAVYMESLYAFHHYGWAPQRALAEVELKLIDSTTPELYRKGDRREAKNLAPADQPELDRMLGRIGALSDAMAPIEGAADQASLSPERVSQLEALGYVTTAGAAAGEVPWRDPAYADPVARLPVLRRLEDVRKAQQEGDLDKARQVAEDILKEEPGLIDPARTLASILLRQGKLDEAEKVVAELEARQPSSQNKAMLGAIAMRRADLPAAVTLYDAALSVDPYLAEAWTPFLHALWLQGDLSRLEKELLRARQHVPDQPVVMGMDGVLLAMGRRCAQARPVLEAAIAKEPGQPFVHHALGMCLRSMEELDAAEAQLQEEILLHPPAIPSRRTLVELYAEQKRYEEQLEQLKVIEEKEPPSPLTAHSKAQALYNLQRYAESRPVVERCMELAPDYPACVMLYANVLKKLGQEEQALETYHKALAMVQQAPPVEPAPVDEAGLANPDRYWKE